MCVVVCHARQASNNENNKAPCPKNGKIKSEMHEGGGSSEVILLTWSKKFRFINATKYFHCLLMLAKIFSCLITARLVFCIWLHFVCGFWTWWFMTSSVAVNPAYTWLGHRYHGDVMSPVSNSASSQRGVLTFPYCALFASCEGKYQQLDFYTFPMHSSGQSSMHQGTLW